MIFVDSSFLVAIVNEDDQWHEKSVKVIIGIGKTGYKTNAVKLKKKAQKGEKI